MTYVKQTWANGIAGGTPVSAARLAHIEDGIEAAAADAASSSALGYEVVDADITGSISATSELQARHDAGEGKVVFIPSGRYLIGGAGLLARVSDITHRGSGMYATTLKSATTYMIQPGGFCRNVTFEDMTFEGQDGTASGQACNLVGTFAQNITFRRCRFTNFARALDFRAIVGITIEDCVFDNPGTAEGDGIQCGNQCRDIKITGNDFMYMENSVVLTGNTPGSVQNVDISNNYFDGLWWGLKGLDSGSGGSVSYSSTVLTHTGHDFTVAMPLTSPYNYFVRVMTTRRTSSGGGVTYTYATNTVTDTGANFTTAGVLRGEIIRSGTAFAIVAGSDATNLYHEGWHDMTTYEPTMTPAAGDAYTVYKIVLGQVLSRTTTTVTTEDFYDLTGTRSTPAAGSYYEITGHSGYGLNCENGVQYVRVIDNTFRRGWSDQCSTFGDHIQIIGNTIEDGQDMGITLQPPTTSNHYNVVMGNRIHHQGTGGIFAGCSDSVISNNLITATQWTSTDNSTMAGIMLYQSRNLVANNSIDGQSGPQSHFGISVISNDVGFPTNDNVISQNFVRGHTVYDIRLLIQATGTMARIHLKGNQLLSTVPFNAGSIPLGTGYDIDAFPAGISVPKAIGYGMDGASGASGGMFGSGNNLVMRSFAAGGQFILQDAVGAAATFTAGACGFNGVAAVGKQTLGAAATDLASVITLANNIRAALIADGLGQN